MRFGSPELVQVLTGSFDFHYTADVLYNGERRIQDLPITDVRWREDADANIQHSGSCTVVWSDEFASSISPDEITDTLAPFGAQLVVYAWVRAGSFEERVEYGRFEITDIPSARDEWFEFRGEWLVAGSVVELELRDLSAAVAEETFDSPESPQALDSTWNEVARLTGFPVLRTVPDVPITRSVLYPDSKWDATYELVSVMLDAVPHVNPNGSLSARPNVWPAPVSQLRMGEGLVAVAGSMSQRGVQNRVVVRAQQGEEILAIAELTNGPLRVRNDDGTVSPYRARTRYLSSEFVTNEAQAREWADAELAKVSVLRARTFTVVETFNPLRERGDVIDVERPTKWLHARVVSIDRSSGPTQTLTVEVSGDTPRVMPPRVPWPPFLFEAPFTDVFTDIF
jgi:hypothetical protein